MTTLKPEARANRIESYKEFLEEALRIIEENPTDIGVRISKQAVKAALVAIGKIGSMPKHGKNRRAA